MNLFFDTNVLLDVLLARAPFDESARALFALAETGRINGSVSAISFPTVSYIMHKGVGGKKAHEALRKVRGIFSIIAADRQIIDQALDSGFPDFEDAIQYYSAVRAGAVWLLTHNLKHYPSGLPVPISPDDLLSSIRE